MIYRTVDGVLNPDGRLTLSPGELPGHPVRVMVTILDGDEGEDGALSELGDYLVQLTDYEGRLERGEIRWQ